MPRIGRVLGLFLCLSGAQASAQGVSTGPSPSGTLASPLITAPSIEADYRSGNVFAASAVTSVGVAPTIPAGSYLNVRLANPAASGVRCVVFYREYVNSAAYNATAVQFGAIASPAAMTSPDTTSNGSNGIVGNGATSACQYTSQVSTTRINNAAGNAIPTAYGPLPVNGVSKPVTVWRILNPGTAFGNFIVGQASGLGSITGDIEFVWAQEQCPASGC